MEESSTADSSQERRMVRGRDEKAGSDVLRGSAVREGVWHAIRHGTGAGAASGFAARVAAQLAGPGTAAAAGADWGGENGDCGGEEGATHDDEEDKTGVK
jgi:hypothetical protein